MLIILWLLACGAPDSKSEVTPQSAGTGPHRVGVAEQAGEKHPPIPANNPGWEHVSNAFKPTPHAYGEERWDDVSMRVIGHLSQATRDLARIEYAAGNAEAAILLYEQLAAKLSRIDLDEKGLSRKVRALHKNAADYHAAIHRKKHGESVTLPDSIGHNSTARWRAIAGEKEPVVSEHPWTKLRIDTFDDFRDRHQLRLKLTEYWLDTVDPFDFSDPWGYWRPEVAEVTALAWSTTKTPQRQLESTYPLQMTVEDIGRLPTGDSYVDTAGGAGPLSIGTLSVLGLDDETHRARLEQWVAELNTLGLQNPGQFVTKIESYIEVFKSYKHGSRFYNIKQLINAGTRHLARMGHYQEALTVFQLHRPLHKQDWLCPNREGIQLGIEGRLAALAGDPLTGQKKLLLAIQESDSWLKRIAGEKARPQPPGPKPPPN